MSYTPTTIELEDFPTVEKGHTHHHHHHNTYANTVSTIGAYKYFICAVFFFLFFGLFLFLVWGSSTTQTTEIQQYVHRLETQFLSGKGFSTNGLYTVTNAFNQLLLCHMALYNAPSGDTMKLVASDTTQFIENKEQIENFVIKTKFDIRFNMGPDQLGYDITKLGIRPDEKYMTVHYEVATNYPYFSTIKLVESTLDLRRRTLVTKREIVLCSNHPSSTERRCNRQTSLNDVIVMNNTRISPMDMIKNATKTSGKISDDLMDNDEKYAQKLEDEISNLRLFHVYFYREAPAREFYKEYLTLGIEPVQCSL